MALSKTLSLTNNFGQQSSLDCYIKVNEVRSSKTNAVANYSIMSNDKSKVYESNDIVFNSDVALDAPNIWTQAYQALKNTDMFKDAVDC